MELSEYQTIKQLPCAIYLWALVAVWTLLLTALLVLDVLKARTITKELAKTEARVVLNKEMALHQDLYSVSGHITSLKNFRPETAPDQWETNALKKFEQGAEEIFKIANIAGESRLRYMKPMFVKESCLKCHGFQGYKPGDVKGGVSISVPMDKYILIEGQKIKGRVISTGFIWLFGFMGIISGGRALNRRIYQRNTALAELEKGNHDLELKVKERTRSLREALSKIKQLDGLLPICSSCKKIRDDKGYWNKIETYIATHSNADFTHSICPECEESLFLNHQERIKQNGKPGF